MIRATRPAFRRGLALAILAAGLAGIYAVVIAPIVGGYSGDSDSIEQLQSSLVRYQKAARELPDLQTRLAALQKSGAGQAGYLDGENEALTAAALQNRLKSLVQREGGQLKSMQSLAGNENAKPKRVAVRIEMVVPIATLQRVLYSLEAGSPFLFVDNLDVRAVAVPRAAGDGQAESLLDVRFDAFGFMRGEI